MTQEEFQSIVNAVLSAIRTNSRTIAQLTAVPSLSDSDSFEVSGGKRVTYGVLKSLIASFSSADTDTLLAQINRKELQSASITTTETTATITIRNVGGTTISCSVPVATDNQAGIITATQKVKIDSAYSNAQSALTQAGEAKSAVQTLNNKLGTASGIATLDANGKLNSNQVPSNVVTDTELDAVEDKADAAHSAADAAHGAADAAQSAASAVAATVKAMKKYGYKFMGVATPTTDPGTPSEKVFYLATTEGDYTNFPTNASTEQGPLYFHLGADEVAILRYTKPTDDSPIISNWSKVTLNLAKQSALAAVQAAVGVNRTAIDDINNALAYRLHLNGNKLVNKEDIAVSLGTFLSDTNGSAWNGIKVRGVVVTLYTTSGLESWQWKGTTWNDESDWKEYGGSAAVGNCFNVTNEVPKPGYYNLTTAIAATQSKGVEAVGMQITFAIAEGSWKTYQYVGEDTTSRNFVEETNWIDLAGMSAGSEAVINVNDLCGEPAGGGFYSLGSAAQAIQTLSINTGVEYRKSGLVIAYRQAEKTWAVKQFRGDYPGDNFTEETLWNDISGQGSKVKTSDTPEESGKDAFSTGGAYNYLVKTIAALSTTEIEELVDNPDTENYNYYRFVNLAGEKIGEVFALPKGGGSASTVIRNINVQASPLYAAAGGEFIVRASIRSIVEESGGVTDNGIASVRVIDRDTSAVLYNDPNGGDSSTSPSDYSWVFNLSSFFTAATTRRIQIEAVDSQGVTFTRNMSVVAVDVTCVSTQVLQYTESSVIFTTDISKSIPMYAFPNNQGNITAITEIYLNGEWRELGRAVINDTYSRNISVDPTALGLTHGAYMVRVHGTFTTPSGTVITGNYIYSDIMVIDPTSNVPVVAMRYNDNAGDGTIKLYDSVVLEIAAYQANENTVTVRVTENGTEITSLEVMRTAVSTVIRQVTGLQDGDTLTYEATADSSSGGTVTITVSGSIIEDVVLTPGAVFGFDFANRTNTESGDHAIESGAYSIELKGANFSSNGFNNYLGANALAVKENVTAKLLKNGSDYQPFGSPSLEASGYALLFQFATANIADSDARLMECYDNTAGAGFYVTGNKVAIFCKTGEDSLVERSFSNGEKVTVGIVVEPESRKIYSNRMGAYYSTMKLFINGEEVGCLGYIPGGSALLQMSNFKFDGTFGDFYLYYLLGWETYVEWRQEFFNYLVKLTNTATMVSEYNFEDVWGANTALGPSLEKMAAAQMPYVIIEPFNGSDVAALDDYTSTSEKRYYNIRYIDPAHPWRNFLAYNVQTRNQGTTSASRPVKNRRFYLAASKGSGVSYEVDGVQHSGTFIKLINPDTTTEEGRRAIALAAINKVQVGLNTIPVDLITVKVDYSDSTNANDCGTCNMMNHAYRALGGDYLTPAQRYYNGTWAKGEVSLTGLQLNHSTANHPIAMYLDPDGTGTSLQFYAKGNWKEDKNEQVALGFKDTPGYNKGCLNYGDFVEFFGTSSETLDQAVTRFLSASVTKDESKVYLISQYCGSSYKFYRYLNGAWTDTTGTMKQVNGAWVITGDVLNPVDGFELITYQGMCWWQGVGSVSDMMAPISVENASSWIKKIADDIEGDTVPAWTLFFECMIDDDQLQIDLANGRKVPYWLYRMLNFCNSCDYANEDVASTFKTTWRNNLYKYANVKSLFVYFGFTDYLAATDQQAKNMQPMFFLDEGGSVEGGVYKYNGVATEDCAVRMYPNKVYDADTLLGKDNDGGATVDAEVDPFKPSVDGEYENPFAGWGSVLWRNMYYQPEVLVDGSTAINLESVIGSLRTAQVDVDGNYMVPFSPEGAAKFFLQDICLKWQKTVSSYDGERKYISYMPTTANALYFYALHGLRLTSLPDFIKTRFTFRDGYYGKGAFFDATQIFQARINAENGATFTIKAAKAGYFGAGYDSPNSTALGRVYLEAGESHTFTLPNNVNGLLLFIYQCGRISEIDLSNITLSNAAMFSVFKLATKIVIGGENYVDRTLGYTKLTNLNLGELPFLRELNVQNHIITSIDASKCPRLERLYADGSQLSSLALAETSPVSVLTLPATISRLTLVNLPNLSYESGCLTFEGMSALTQIRIDGCPMLDGAKLLTDALAAGAAISRLRLAGIDVTGNSNTLVSLMSSGVTGIAADGTAYDESGQCSGLTGVWTCSDVIEATLLASLQAYFPLLTIYNAQFTVVQLDDSKTAPAEDSVINLDNGTYANDGKMGYVASGHITKIKAMMHVYKSVYDESAQKMKCYQLDDDDIELLANGESFDRTDAGGEGYDVMLGLPHFWYKGVNDALNRKKYLVLSSETGTPRSTASAISRVSLAATIDGAANPALVAEYVAVYMSAFNVGDVFSAANLGQSSTTKVYQMDVEGMKQVRWPTMSSSTTGILFLDKDGKVISKFAPSIADSMTDFLAGDYVFMDVPANAVRFVFTVPITFGNTTTLDESEAIAVNSTAVEAIEPDWVEHEFELIGTYKAFKDALHRLRSVSGVAPTRGSGTSTTSSYWQYDANGNVVSALPDSSRTFNMTYLDFRNLSRCRGAGYQLVDYEMHKCVDILFLACFGSRNSQSLFGNGQGNGAQTGGSDIYTTNIERDASPLREASRPRFFGLEDWWGNCWEFMDFVAINVKSYAEYYKNKCEVPAGSDTDRVWHIRMPDGTERAVKGDPNSNSGEIVRLRWGRFCDVVPSKLHTNNSYNQYYCDQQDMQNSTGRVVARSGHYFNANYGFVYVNASNASSYSYSVSGARLAFRGAIEIVE